jgi:hypothetical protein
MNDHQVYAAVAILVVLAMALWLSLRALRRAEQLERQQACWRPNWPLHEKRWRAPKPPPARPPPRRASPCGDRGRLAGIEEQQEQLRLLGEGVAVTARLSVWRSRARAPRTWPGTAA